MVVGWFGVGLGLACVAASSQIIGRPVWWLDDQRFPNQVLALFLVAVFALPMGLALWSMFYGPWVPHLSLVGAVELAVLALSERHRTPGAAVVLATLAVAALLLAIASFAGLYRVAGAVDPGRAGDATGEPLDQG